MKKYAGLGLVECLIATLIFVSSAVALSSLTFKWQWRIRDVVLHMHVTAQQQWLQARLIAITPATYGALAEHVPVLVQSLLNRSVESSVMQPQQIQSLAAEMNYTNSEIAGSHRVNLAVTVALGPDNGPIAMQATAYRPATYRYPSTLPSTD